MQLGDWIFVTVWSVGAVVAWYPVYERLLKSFGGSRVDTEDRVFAGFISCICALAWPLGLIVLPLLLVFWISRALTNGVRQLIDPSDDR